MRILLFTLILFTAFTTHSGIQSELRKKFKKSGVQALKPEKLQNKQDLALFKLGQALFFDQELSGTRNISCATCHHPSAGSSDGLVFGFGHGAQGRTVFRRGEVPTLAPRNSTSVFNAGHKGYKNMFWDGRLELTEDEGFISTSPYLTTGDPDERKDITSTLDSLLAAQALLPIANPPEMRGIPGMNEIADAKTDSEAWDLIMVRLLGDRKKQKGIKGYHNLFRLAYPTVKNFNPGHMANAIARFQEVAFSAAGTPLDQFLSGDNQALTGSVLEGAQIFAGKAQCLSCHKGPHLSDFNFHSLGLNQFGIGARGTGLNFLPIYDPSYGDPGRADFTGQKEDRFKFRTAPLRNVSLTGPYMHNGQYDTVGKAIRHHLSPKKSFENFDVETLPLEMYALNYENYQVNDDEILEQMPEMMKKEIKLSPREFRALLDFVNVGLTDPGSLSLERWIPNKVPSGLPVEK